MKRLHHSGARAWRGVVMACASLLACLSSADGRRCGSVTCDAGRVCLQDECRVACSTAADCPEAEPLCLGGSCRPSAAQCSRDADCVSPAPCETRRGARCADGACRYESKTCASPPEEVCVAGDSLLRAYGYGGSCDPQTGECIYPQFDFPCPECAATCLSRCQAIDCVDRDGGCTSNGRCTPTDPAVCEFDRFADGAACAHPEGVGACFRGKCLPAGGGACTANSECGGDSCLAQACRPRSEVGAPCDLGDLADCNAGLECAEGFCLRPSGSACGHNSECAGTCFAGACQPRAGVASACDPDDAADCQAGLVCRVGVCRRPAGSACADNRECAEACIAGLCVPAAAAGAACDAGDHDDCLSGFCVDDACVKADGVPGLICAAGRCGTP